MLYLKRKIDAFLSEWKANPDKKPLIVKGPRQVGKTESIQRFAAENYTSVITINFVEEPKYKMITADGIIRYVRAMQNSMGSNVETLYKIVANKAEALEFRVTESSTVCGVPLLKLELRPNLLVCCINRGGQILIPSGQDTIEPGDTVVVVSSTPGLRELDDILAGHRGYGHE